MTQGRASRSLPWGPGSCDLSVASVGQGGSVTSSPVFRVSALFLPTQLPSPPTEGERTALPQKQMPAPCSHPDCCFPRALEGPGSGHAGPRLWPPGSPGAQSAQRACDPPLTFRLEARLPTSETTNQSTLRWAFHLRGLSR